MLNIRPFLRNLMILHFLIIFGVCFWIYNVEYKHGIATLHYSLFGGEVRNTPPQTCKNMSYFHEFDKLEIHMYGMSRQNIVDCLKSTINSFSETDFRDPIIEPVSLREGSYPIVSLAQAELELDYLKAYYDGSASISGTGFFAGVDRSIEGDITAFQQYRAVTDFILKWKLYSNLNSFDDEKYFASEAIKIEVVDWRGRWRWVGFVLLMGLYSLFFIFMHDRKFP